MDKSEKYQKMADGTLEWVAAKAFIDDEMTQEERENLHMDWVLEVAIAKRFGENPNPRKEKVLRYLEQVKGIYTAKRNGEPQSEPLPDGKQENADQQPKKKGKPVKSFKDKMVDDVDGKKLQKIHSVMSGKTGKDAVLIVYACFDNGWVVSKPSYTAVKDEFGEVVCKSQYDGYWKGAKDIFTEQEIDGVKKNLTIEEGEK